MWGISRTSYLSASGSQARTVLFSSDMSFLLRFDHVWEAFGFYPTSARNAPHACLINHAWGAFLDDVGQNPKASQKWVEPEEETHVA